VTNTLLVKIGAAVVATVAVGVTAYALVAGDGGSGGQARAWVDEPLTGITVPLAPLEVIAHAYDAGGVDEVRLAVAGEETATETPEAAGQELVDATFTWVPPEPGVYVLEVVGLSGGSEGAVGRATVTVSDVAPPPTTTTTAPDSSTSTSTTTTATTAPPPVPDGPTPPAADDTPPTVSVTGPTSILDYQRLTITATASDDRGLDRIEIWARKGTSGDFALQELCSGPPTCTWSSFQQAGVVQYYAVAVDAAGNQARTPTRSVTVIAVPR
jgi:hypothetical protein